MNKTSERILNLTLEEKKSLVAIYFPDVKESLIDWEKTKIIESVFKNEVKIEIELYFTEPIKFTQVEFTNLGLNVDMDKLLYEKAKENSYYE